MLWILRSAIIFIRRKLSMVDNFFYFKKLLVLLRAQTVVGGLEISDTALRFAVFRGREWQFVSLRLPPGVVKGGKVASQADLTAHLVKLKSQIPGRDSPSRIVSVVVVLGSLNVYTQVVSLPILEERELNEAVKLNLQMVAPSATTDAYSGWQIVGEDKNDKKLDILSAFLDRSVAEDFSKVLRAAGFLPVALESRAMALARLVRERGIGIDKSQSYIVLVLDNDALDFLVLRRGELYFEYPNYWRDLKGEGKLISLLDFRTAIAGNLRRVLNFYSQHWSDQLMGVIVVASGLNEEVRRIIGGDFSLAVKKLELRLEKPVEVDWLTVLGSGLRGTMKRNEDKEISLLGTTAHDEFRGEQIMSFMRFWRVLMPVGLGLMLTLLFGANFMLAQRSQSLKGQNLISDQEKLKEVEKLQEEARLFNRMVELVAETRRSEKFKSAVLVKMDKLLTDYGISLARFNFRDFNAPVTLYGQTKVRDQIRDFEKALKSDPQIKDVNLPLTEIKDTAQGFSFSISFVVTSPTKP